MKDSGVDEEVATNLANTMRGSFKEKSEDEKKSWAQRQTFLALGNAVNGTKSLGFDSCPMEGFQPEDYSKILELPKNIHPTALCTLGYAADEPRQKIRFPQKDVFI